MITEKPWGREELLKKGEHTWVKILTIYPGQRISLQKHNKRVEMWTIISGKGIITLDNEEYLAKQHDTVVIPEKVIHRIHNYLKDQNLIICEVATGNPEDSDIERIQDDYGR